MTNQELVELVLDALGEFGDENIERRIGPDDVQKWLDRWLQTHREMGKPTA